MCFDAKECAADTFALANIHEHQVNFMENFEKQGGVAFFLLFFSHKNQFYYLPYAHLRYFWDRAKEGGRKSFRYDELNPEYFLPKKQEMCIRDSIFMWEDQVMEEIQGVMKLIDEVYQRFGFAYEIELSTRPEKSIGTDEEWALATKALEETAKGMNKPYVFNEGDGAFYGPKLDFHLKDSIGRARQCGTIQLDFQFQVL